MAKTVEELQVLITANAANFQRQMSAVQKQLGGLEKNTSGLSKGFGGVGAAAVAMGSVISSAIVGAFGALNSSVDDAITRLDVLNNYPAMMSNLGIEASRSEASIKRLSDGLQGLPTTLDSAAMAVQRLTSSNGNIEASTEMFLALNNAVLAGGAPMDLQRTALEQLTQAYTKGKPDMVEWRSAMTAMPAQLKQVATAMGYASADALGESLRNGSVSMNDFLGAIMKLNQEGLPGLESFAQQARNSTGGVATSIANMKTAIVRGMAQVMDAIGQANIAAFFNGISAAIAAVTPYVVAFVKVMSSAVGYVSALFGGFGGGGGGKMDAVAGAVGHVKDAVGGVGQAVSDVATGVGGVGKGLGKAGKAARALKKELAGFDEMNVINEKSGSGSGGGGSGGGAGGGGGGPLPASGGGKKDGKEEISEAEKIAARIRAAFAKLFELVDFKPLIKSFKALWVGVKHVVTGIIGLGKKIITHFIAPVAKYLIEAGLPKIFTAIGNALASIDFSAIQNSLTPVLEGFAKLAIGIVTIAAAVIDKVAPAVAFLVNLVVPPALSLIGVALEVIASVFGSIMEVAGQAWAVIEPLFTHFASIVKPVIQKLGALFDVLRKNETMMNVLKGAAIVLATVAIAPLAVGIVALTATLTAVAHAIDLTVNLFLAGWHHVSAIWKGAAPFFKGVWDGIVRSLKSAPSWFGSVFSAAYQRVMAAFNSAPGWFSSVFSRAMGAISHAFGGIGGWAQARLADIVRPFNSVFSIFSGIGVNIWRGLRRGIGNIADRMTGIFRNVVSSVKRTLGINSPSRVFAQFGKYVDEGFVNGLDSGMGQVDKAMQRLTSAFDINKDYTINPILNEGIDLDAQMSNLNSKLLAGVPAIETSVVQAIESNNKTAVTVNIGEDKILDKIIDGINNKGFTEDSSIIVV